MPEGQLLVSAAFPNDSKPHRLRISVVVIGSGLLLATSALNPYQVPPFGGHYYLYWLAGITVVLGAISILRREKGHLALAAAIVTVAAAAFILVTFGVSVVSIIVMKLFMSD